MTKTRFDEIFGNVMLVLIVVLFCYLLISRTYLHTKVAFYTTDGEFIWADEYGIMQTNQPQFLTDAALNDFNVSDFDLNFTVYGENNGS